MRSFKWLDRKASLAAITLCVCAAHARADGPTGQQAYIKASNTGASDSFTHAVAISGDTLVVGAWAEDSNATGVNGDESNNGAPSAGAAYVFVRSGSTWTQQAYLKASNTNSGDNFGSSVAIDGDTIVVGAQGEDSSATGVGGNQLNNSLEFSGAAYVFVRSGTSWAQQAYLKATNTGFGDYFGLSVAVAGDIVVVGAPNDASNSVGIDGDGLNNAATYAGGAHVFARSGTTWTHQAYLKASNTGAGDVFGTVVAASGNSVIVGAFLEDSNATGVNGNQLNDTAQNAGAAYVFVRTGGVWSQQAYLKASNTEGNDRFAMSVGMSGDTIVAGAFSESSSATGVNGSQGSNLSFGSGAAYVFVRNGTLWSQQAYLKASNTGSLDLFGYAVAVSGDAVAVGAFSEDSSATGVNGNQADNSALESGAVYVFARSGSQWSPLDYLKASNTGNGDQFGFGLSLSGSSLAVAAINEDSSATGVNDNQADNSALESGAAYVFTLNLGPTSFCLGDGTQTACPCSNPGASGHGCASSAFASGAILSAAGVAGVSAGTDTLVLTATHIPGPGLFFQSNGLAPTPVNFGDGHLCAAVGITRLGVVFSTGGIASYPGGLTPSPIHTAGAPINAGETKHYQCWYRSQPGLCNALNYDMTQGLTITWRP